MTDHRSQNLERKKLLDTTLAGWVGALEIEKRDSNQLNDGIQSSSGTIPERTLYADRGLVL